MSIAEIPMTQVPSSKEISKSKSQCWISTERFLIEIFLLEFLWIVDIGYWSFAR
jgi:hypothetical protein